MKGSDVVAILLTISGVASFCYGIYYYAANYGPIVTQTTTITMTTLITNIPGTSFAALAIGAVALVTLFLIGLAVHDMGP